MAHLDYDFYYKVKKAAQFLPSMYCSLKLHHLKPYQEDLDVGYGFITVAEGIERLKNYLRQTQVDQKVHQKLSQRIERLEYLCPDYLIEAKVLKDINQKVVVLSLQDILDKTRMSAE